MKLTNFKPSNEIAKREVALAPTAIEKLTDSYDEHAKLVFIFDASGSMGMQMAKDWTNRFEWSPRIVADIRLKANEARVRVDAWNEMPWSERNRLSEEQDAKLRPTPVECELSRVADRKSTDRDGNDVLLVSGDDAVMDAAAKHPTVCGLLLKPGKNADFDAPPSRTEAVKKFAKAQIEKRLARYPKSNVAVVFFAGKGEIKFNGGTKEDLFETLGSLGDGGGNTRILEGIRAGIKACQERPSAIGIHHLVVVSDGQDSSTYDLPSWMPTLRASGVVLDYIHIGEDENVNEHLKTACAELGGEAVVVDTVDALETKFIAAAERKMLPAPEPVV